MRPIFNALRHMSHSSPSIALNPTEFKFITLLDEYASKLTPPVECRIAGGWVRDKILSLPSADLDVALSIPSGHTFAVGFVNFLKTRDVPTGSVGRVAANPNQSKHLETGTTKIMGLGCDFVGLRSETYTDSRIPSEIRLGTPEEDALRRDLTINTLFYNVHSKEIEDYTKRGLSDLSNKIARTPLAPRQTFQDDPLRVLRCVRFASRFNLSIEDSVSEAIQDPDIKAALRTKVSKERIGIEVSKMMHDDPLRAITLIDSMGLHQDIFSSSVDVPRNDAVSTAQILSHVGTILETDWILWLAAALSPFRDMTVSGKKELPAVAVVISEALKLSNETKNAVANLFAGSKLVDPTLQSRSAIGTTLQDSTVRPWQRTLTWATVMAILPQWSEAWDKRCDDIAQPFRELRERIEDLGLPESIDKPLLLDVRLSSGCADQKGKALQALLRIRPSPLLQIILTAVNVWQLDNPSGTREDCEQWVLSRWEGEGRGEWEAMLPQKARKTSG